MKNRSPGDIHMVLISRLRGAGISRRAAAIILAVSIGGAVALGAQGYTPGVAEVGKVNFTVVCIPETFAHIERGAALLHSFWYEEARKAFRNAADTDPDCAMAAWGESMTWTHPLWDPPSADALKQGLAAARRAKSVGGRDAREQGYIDAVLAMYDEHETVSQPLRMQRYSRAMEKLSRAHPSDLNAAAFHALSLLSLTGGSAEDQARQAAKLLVDKFGTAPDHPGAVHYLIHAYDNPQDAAKGLPPADKYASTAPSVPHALHMPAHIYTRLGMWDKAVASNEAAWKASDSDAHAGTELTHGGMRDYHSLQWLHYAYLQLGRYAVAAETLAVMRKHAEREAGSPLSDRPDKPDGPDAAYYLTDMSARDALERRDWKAALELPDGGAMRNVEATRWYARGLGAARAAWPGGQGPMVAVAREAAQKLDAIAAKGGRASRTGVVELQRLGVLAAIAGAQEEQDELTLLLTQAKAIENGLLPPGQPAVPVIPIHELAGDLFMIVHRYPDARLAYEAALKRYPKRARSMYGVALATAKLGDAAAARAAYEAFLEQWKSADPDRPEVVEAKAYLAGSPSPGSRR